MDWADELALTIVREARTYGLDDACGLIAARLRLVREQGICFGIDETRGVVDAVFTKGKQAA